MSSLKSVIFAIAAAVPLAFASPIPGEANNSTDVTIQSAPVWYSGPWYNFPAMDTWKTFDQLVSILHLSNTAPKSRVASSRSSLYPYYLLPPANLLRENSSTSTSPT